MGILLLVHSRVIRGYKSKKTAHSVCLSEHYILDTTSGTLGLLYSPCLAQNIVKLSWVYQDITAARFAQIIMHRAVQQRHVLRL
jgi:hypothetical protein